MDRTFRKKVPGIVEIFLISLATLCAAGFVFAVLGAVHWFLCHWDNRLGLRIKKLKPVEVSKSQQTPFDKNKDL